MQFDELKEVQCSVCQKKFPQIEAERTCPDCVILNSPETVYIKALLQRAAEDAIDLP